MNNKTRFFFIILSTYIILQFAWWGYHLIELSQKTEATPDASMRRVGMILGEGMVFFIILIFGLWQIRKSIQKDILLSRRQSNFSLSITHELKTPIQALSLNADAILEVKDEPDKVVTFANKIKLQTNRLNDLVREIINLSKLQDSDPMEAAQEVEISDVIKEAIDQCEAPAQVRKIKINTYKKNSK